MDANLVATEDQTNQITQSRQPKLDSIWNEFTIRIGHFLNTANRKFLCHEYMDLYTMLCTLCYETVDETYRPSRIYEMLKVFLQKHIRTTLLPKIVNFKQFLIEWGQFREKMPHLNGVCNYVNRHSNSLLTVGEMALQQLMLEVAIQQSNIAASNGHLDVNRIGEELGKMKLLEIPTMQLVEYLKPFGVTFEINLQAICLSSIYRHFDVPPMLNDPDFIPPFMKEVLRRLN